MTPRPGHADDLAAARLAAWLRIAAPIAVLALAIGAGLLRGMPLAVLVLAAGALAAVIALFWQSVRTLVGETRLTGADAFAIGTPHAEEERKRAVLRALKDLEFERSVGKISEADYRELVAHYRGQAKRLLRQIDDASQPRRDRVAKLVEERLRAAGLAGGLEEAHRSRAPGGDDGSAGTGEVEPTQRLAEPTPPTSFRVSDPDAGDPEVRPACATCATVNDRDAAFCKKCGKPLAEQPADAEASA